MVSFSVTYVNAPSAILPVPSSAINSYPIVEGDDSKFIFLLPNEMDELVTAKIAG